MEINGYHSNEVASSNTIPLASPSKRGRGRPPKKTPPFSADATLREVLTGQPLIKTPVKVRRNSAGTPRELKALLTWDAMMKANQVNWKHSLIRPLIPFIYFQLNQISNSSEENAFLCRHYRVFILLLMLMEIDET